MVDYKILFIGRYKIPESRRPDLPDIAVGILLIGDEHQLHIQAFLQCHIQSAQSCLYAGSILTPILVQSEFGYDATTAGLVLSPGGLATSVGPVASPTVASGSDELY